MKKPLFYISLLIFSWTYALLFRSVDWDLWARLSVGKIFFETGRVLKNDIFSYTITKSMWIDHEWGSGVVFYFLANHFGDFGILAFKIIGTFLVLFLISKIVKLQNIKINAHLNLLWYFLATVGMYYGVGSTVRCQLFTFIFFTLWIYILERVRRGENRLLWILPVTSLIWANLHGGFVSGLGLIGIYGVGELLNRKPFKKYFLILIPAVLITLINPYGIKYWEFILHAATMPRITISEWLPTGIFPLIKWKGFKIFAVTAILAFIYTFIKNIYGFKDLGKKLLEVDKVKYLLIFITFYLAMKHNKHQALFVISAASFLYHSFYGIFADIGNFLISKFGEIAQKTLNTAVKTKDIAVYIIVIIFMGIPLLTSDDNKIIVDPLKFPVGAVEFVKENNLSGNILTLFHWGSYIAWKLYPDNLISEDGRYEEVYPEEIHMKVYNFNYKINERWLDITKEYHTDIIIMEKMNFRSYEPMLKNKEWKQIYDDLISGVFVPVQKAKKTYKMPEITRKTIIYDKYKTGINFLD